MLLNVVDLSLILRILLVAIAGFVVAESLWLKTKKTKLQKKGSISFVIAGVIAYSWAILDLNPGKMSENIDLARMEISRYLKKDTISEVSLNERYVTFSVANFQIIGSVFLMDSQSNKYTLILNGNDPFFIEYVSPTGMKDVIRGNRYEFASSKTDGEKLIIQKDFAGNVSGIFLKKKPKTIEDLVIVRINQFI